MLGNLLSASGAHCFKKLKGNAASLIRLGLLCWLVCSAGSKPALGKNILYFVMQSEFLAPVREGDVGYALADYQAFKYQLEQQTRDTELRLLKVEDLGEDFVAKAVSSLPVGSALKGFMFSGHGNRQNFALSKEHIVTGEELAEAILRVAAQVQLSRDVIIYVGSCLGGCPISGSKGLQKTIVETLKRGIPFLAERTDHIQVIAHIYLANNVARGQRLSGLISWALYQTGVAEAVAWLQARVFAGVDPKAFMIGVNTLPGLGASSIVAFAALTRSQHLHMLASSLLIPALVLPPVISTASHVGSEMVDATSLHFERGAEPLISREKGLFFDVFLKKLNSCAESLLF